VGKVLGAPVSTGTEKSYQFIMAIDERHTDSLRTSLTVSVMNRSYLRPEQPNRQQMTGMTQQEESL